MRDEIRKILEMNRSGKVNDAQAAELLEALLEKPAFSETSETEEMHAEYGSDDDIENVTKNSAVFSKVDPVIGTEFSFTDNSINVSAFTRIKLNKSHIRDNSINASKLADFDFTESQFSDCSVNGSAIDGLIMNKAQLHDVALHGSKLAKLSLVDQCSFTDARLDGCSGKNLVLKNRSRVQDTRFSGAQLANWELVTSSLHDVSLQGVSLLDVQMRNSHWQDLEIRGIRIQQWSMSNSTVRDCKISGQDRSRSCTWEGVQMTNSSFTDVVFERCHLENVTFVDVHLKDLRLRDLDLRNRTIRSSDDLR